MINAIIIDDELQARKLLSTLLNNHCKQVTILEQCADLPNGVKAIRKYKPQLVFLDVEMPGHSGLEILDFFDEKEIDFGIIFTTAYNEYAIKAFKLSAVDYLLKPISGEDLEQAIERFERRFQGSSQKLEEKHAEKIDKKIAVPIGQSIKFIDPETIVFLKAENTYTEIHLQDGSKLVVSRTLKNFEESLIGYSDFVRCHKSYIVNVQYIENYVKSDGGYLHLTNQKDIPINSESVEELINQYNLVKR